LRFAFLISGAVLTTFLQAPARAEFRTGKDLIAECSAAPGDALHSEKRTACLAYISGVLDSAWMHSEWGKGLRFCIPDGVTLAQLREHVIAYANSQHQQVGDATAALTVTMTAATKFPCHAQAGGQ
jgi:hypothetical protein